MALRRAGAFEIRREFALPVVSLHGDLDLSTIGEFQSVLDHACESEGPGVVIDLADVTYLDSVAVHTLFRLGCRLRDGRKSAVLVTPRSASVCRVLEITRVERVLPLAATISAGINSILGTRLSSE